MIVVDLHKMDLPTPKGCHRFLVNHVTPSGLEWIFASSIILSSLRDWMLRNIGLVLYGIAKVELPYSDEGIVSLAE